MDILRRLAENLDRLAAESGKIVSADGKRIGPGKGTSRNMQPPLRPEKTGEEARNAERYRNFRLGQPTGIESMSDEERQAAIDDVVKRFVQEMVERDVLKDL